MNDSRNLRMMFKVNNEEIEIIEKLIKKTRLKNAALIEVAIEFLLKSLNNDSIKKDDLSSLKIGGERKQYRVSEETRERIKAIITLSGLNQSVILYYSLKLMLDNIEQGKTIPELIEPDLFL